MEQSSSKFDDSDGTNRWHCRDRNEGTIGVKQEMFGVERGEVKFWFLKVYGNGGGKQMFPTTEQYEKENNIPGIWFSFF